MSSVLLSSWAGPTLLRFARIIESWLLQDNEGATTVGERMTNRYVSVLLSAAISGKLSFVSDA
jgi:hypothetical protein